MKIELKKTITIEMDSDDLGFLEEKSIQEAINNGKAKIVNVEDCFSAQIEDEIVRFLNKKGYYLDTYKGYTNKDKTKVTDVVLESLKQHIISDLTIDIPNVYEISIPSSVRVINLGIKFNPFRYDGFGKYELTDKQYERLSKRLSKNSFEKKKGSYYLITIDDYLYKAYFFNNIEHTWVLDYLQYKNEYLRDRDHIQSLRGTKI